MTATLYNQGTLQNGPTSVASDTSDHYWTQAGPTPTLSEMRTPTPTEQEAHAQQTAMDEEDKDFEEGLSESTRDSVFHGKPSTHASRGNDFPNARKRSLASILTPNAGMSPTTEGRIRNRNKRHRASLPNENDVYPALGSVEGNPWALSSDDEGAGGQGNAIIDGPDATSTPVLRPISSSAALPHVPDENFFLDDVNASGNPPTPYCMQNSSFLARLRRSAEEAKRQNREIGRTIGAADRSLPMKGGSSSLPRTSPIPFSSPLPPSSPIPSSSPIHFPLDSPTGRRTLGPNEGAEDLMVTSKMRLTSILSDPEGPLTSRASVSMQAHRARSGRTAAGTSRQEAAAYASHPARVENRTHPSSTRDTGARRSRTVRPPPGDEHGHATTEEMSTTFVPLPNTRAARHLQQQILERAAELAADRAAGRPREPGEDGRFGDRRQSELTPGPILHSVPHSAMDTAPVSPRSAVTMESFSPPPPTQRREQSLSYLDLDEESGQGDEHSQDPYSSPQEANTTGPLAIPTILTAAAPDIDRPMPADPWRTYRVHRDDPEAIIRGISRRWAQAIWGDPPRTSVLLEVFNFTYTDSIHANRLMVETLRRAIYVIAGARDVSLVPPDVDPTTSWRQRDAPRVWAVRGLTPAQEEILLSRFPWSLRAISFFVYKRTVTPDTWLFALEGFFDEDTHAIASAVRDVLEEPEQWAKLAVLTRDRPDLRHLSENERVTAILDSIEVRTWRLSNLNVVANVFIKPPTRDIPKWREWAAGLRMRTYGNFTNGTGVVRRVSNCLGCNSVEHPAHRCPFHDLPGWNGPRAGSGLYSTLLPPQPQPPLQPNGAQNMPQVPGSARMRQDSRRGQGSRGAAPRTPARWRQGQQRR